jgi:hypothetical protein
VLTALLLLTIALNPIDTLAKNLSIVVAAVLSGTVGLVAVRKWHIAPCPYCNAELYAAIKAALRRRSQLRHCPRCGNSVEVST